ncbi:hypothetical protein LV716_08355 [Flagellimonas sp. HMM57]|uniref:hypothetical protein n=1 Tax=unclassified Flagellimonas TaxID=2644544 RepID=UPI0013D1C472|nr:MULTISPECIES: hypothetical protein [unclassified Flagellimonas]UII77766.1 hypothetical protein LV716_08355 [Flagellimonas sp. HMM57]
MKRLLYYSAEWRNKDIDFLRSLPGINKDIEVGYDSFTVEENSDTHLRIVDFYSKKKLVLGNSKPKNFISTPATAIFTKEELSTAKNYLLLFTGESKGSPQPAESYLENTYDFKCKVVGCWEGRKQKALFRIPNIKWKKGQVNFTLLEHDVMFFKKDFYQEVLSPLGLAFKEVIDHKTGKISSDIIQLDIPEAKSKLLIEDTAYDIEEPCGVCGVKQFTMRTLDFLPPFEEKFEFYICRTQEQFGGGMRRIIITKQFSDLLVKHKIIRYDNDNLVPVRNC